jgi:hypothetical protein
MADDDSEDESEGGRDDEEGAAASSSSSSSSSSYSALLASKKAPCARARSVQEHTLTKGQSRKNKGKAQTKKALARKKPLTALQFDAKIKKR